MSLVVTDLQKSFDQGGKKIEILRGIDFALEDGKSLAILGKSGSGKSTLLSLLGGLDKQDRGRIVIDGEDTTAFTDSDWTRFRGRKVGIVFQQYHLVPHLTALENVMLPLEIQGVADARKIAATFLDEVELSHRGDHWPSQLSGGESQRVSIARALATSPKLLLADEPSGSLDAETGETVMSFFFSVVRRHKMTTVLVTHNPDLANFCDRQVVIAGGKM